MSPKTAPTIAGRMLCASGLAYSVPNNVTINPPNSNINQTVPYYVGAGYKTPPSMIANKSSAHAACTVGMNQDGIVLALRGTVYNSFGDWINDLLVKMVAVPGIPGKVHDGFNNAVVAIITPIVNTINLLLKANPKSPVFITGHSKGGGMGPVMAYYLLQNKIKVSGLYLFAPPLPGDMDFANAFNTIFPNTYLYENYQDIVPVLPPSPSDAGALAYDFYKAGTVVSRDVAAAIAIVGLLGYNPVGSLANTFFIPAPTGSKPVSMTNAIHQLQLSVLVAPILKGDFSVFSNAHSHDCGKGYMSSICPSVCTPVKKKK